MAYPFGGIAPRRRNEYHPRFATASRGFKFATAPHGLKAAGRKPKGEPRREHMWRSSGDDARGSLSHTQMPSAWGPHAGLHYRACADPRSARHHAPRRGLMEIVAYIGLDWADAAHAVHLQPADGGAAA